MTRAPSPSSLPSRYRPSPSVRSAVGDGFLILLDLDSGSYLSFNSVAAEVWRRLGDGQPFDRVVASLAREHDVPPERVESDIGALVGDLTSRELLRPAAPGTEVPRRPAAAPAAATRLAAPGRRASFTGGARAGGGLAGTARGMRLGGFRRLLGLLERADRRDGDPPDEAVAAAVSRTVDSAAALYYRKAWCLQRSAACAWLLRRRGFDARLVLGVRPMPFFAHAWVELDGRLVNDEPDRLRGLTVLDRFG